MTGEIVNLRRAKKARARAGRAAEAAGNRARFGRTRAETAQDAANARIDADRLEGAKRDGTDGPGGEPGKTGR